MAAKKSLLRSSRSNHGTVRVHSAVARGRTSLRARLDALIDQFVTAALGLATTPEWISIDRHRLRRLQSLRTAVEWQLQLDTGEVKSRAEIARREGITRAAVTQKMHLLDRFGVVDTLEPGDSASPVRSEWRAKRDGASRGYRELREQLLRDFEKEYVATILRQAANNVSEAARIARIDRKHFWRLLQRTGTSTRRE